MNWRTGQRTRLGDRSCYIRHRNTFIGSGTFFSLKRIIYKGLALYIMKTAEVSVGKLTKFDKTIRRECRRANWRGRPLVVELNHEYEAIIFRLKGMRTGYSLPVLAGFHLAARLRADEIRRERRKNRKRSR